MRFSTAFCNIILLLILLSACGGKNYAPISDRGTNGGSFSGNYGTGQSFICQNPEYFKSRSIGSGECVDFVKACSGAPHTRHWKPGEKVANNAQITKGTAIATFKRNKYPNKSGYHAAIYSHQTDDAIYVWDQWVGSWNKRQKVHLRAIAKNNSNKPSNNAFRYRVIRN